MKDFFNVLDKFTEKFDVVEEELSSESDDEMNKFCCKGAVYYVEEGQRSESDDESVEYPEEILSDEEPDYEEMKKDNDADKFKDSENVKDIMDDICETLEDEIVSSEMDSDTKKEMLKKLRKLYRTETNIMLVGATGCGKSSTINALFSCGQKKDGEMISETVEMAKVGTKADPETKEIEKYTIGNLILWDTPGLGDGTEIDEQHKELIRELLREEDEDGNALIDLVLVVLDGSTKDLGTSYRILNEVIIQEMEEKERILVALNQADIAMKTGRHWNYEKNQPDEVLVKYLEEKLNSIKTRIKEDSDLDIEPIYYCAGYKEEEGTTVYPYNLSKLLYYILTAIPSHKRMSVMAGINTDSEHYEYNDGESDYNERIKDEFEEVLEYFVSEGVDSGAEIGETILGIPGAAVGAIIGGAVGCIRGLICGIFA